MTTETHAGCPVHAFDHTDQTHREPSLRPFYEELLSARVSWSTEHGGFWVVAHDRDVRSLERNVEVFSSAEGVIFPRLPGQPRGFALEYDAPEQRVQHRAYTEWLDKEHLAASTPMMVETTERYVQEFVDQGGGDFVADVSEKLPVEIICHLLGFTENAVTYRKVSQRIAAGDAQAQLELVEAVAGELAERRANPRDDFVSRFLQSDMGDHPVSEEEALGFTLSALVAGHETTLSAGAGLVFELARDGDLQQRLRDDPSLVPAAVSEALRLHAPVQSFFRTVSKEVTIGGQTMRVGDRVMLVYAAANLDPSSYPDPTAFRLDRPRGRHLSFGHGTHRCVGAGLAELELAILASSMLEHPFHLSGPVQYGPPTFQGAFLGFGEVPIGFGG